MPLMPKKQDSSAAKKAKDRLFRYAALIGPRFELITD